MRIISGEFRGRRLQMLRDDSIRPATDRVKGSIFNMLQNRLSLINALVLDLFAGSGNLSFEALSRGASEVVLVETGRAAIELMRANAEALGCEERCTILQEDALHYIEHCREKYDLIFADPPYRYEEVTEIPGLIFKHGLLKKEGFLIIEHSKHTIFAESPDYTLSVCKEFGNTRVSFFINPLQGDGL
jgi:16S rRNA (guanine966-N2)-methyltransferase